MSASSDLESPSSLRKPSLTTQLGVFTFSFPSDKRRKRNKGRKEGDKDKRERERKKEKERSLSETGLSRKKAVSWLTPLNGLLVHW